MSFAAAEKKCDTLATHLVTCHVRSQQAFAGYVVAEDSELVGYFRSKLHGQWGGVVRGRLRVGDAPVKGVT